MTKRPIALVPALTLLAILLVGTKPALALQEVAGPIEFDVKVGDSKSMQWGLISDDNNSTTLKLTAIGPGSEILSYPHEVIAPPHQLVNVNLTVTVPADHQNNVQYNPTIYATELGKQGGAVVVNIQVAKSLTIKIGSPPPGSAGSTVPEFSPTAEFFAVSILFIVALSAMNFVSWKSKLRF